MPHRDDTGIASPSSESTRPPGLAVVSFVAALPFITAGVLGFLVLSHGWLAPVIATTILILVLEKQRRLRFLWTPALALLMLEAWACVMSWHTEGKVGQVYHLFVFSLNTVALMLLIVGRGKYALAGLLAPALYFVMYAAPLQLELTARWLQLDEEVGAISEYAREVGARDRHYPADLNDYPWKRVELREHITYARREYSGSFQVGYWVGERDARHWFDARTGWDYDPGRID